MTFGNDTAIEPCDEVDIIPQLNISLCPLNEINNKTVTRKLSNCRKLLQKLKAYARSNL